MAVGGNSAPQRWTGFSHRVGPAPLAGGGAWILTPFDHLLCVSRLPAFTLPPLVSFYHGFNNHPVNMTLENCWNSNMLGERAPLLPPYTAQHFMSLLLPGLTPLPSKGCLFSFHVRDISTVIPMKPGIFHFCISAFMSQNWPLWMGQSWIKPSLLILSRKCFPCKCHQTPFSDFQNDHWDLCCIMWELMKTSVNFFWDSLLFYHIRL